ncbi:PREDICTED: apical endosomal glycoprotein [Thamnophis sirtalis]|uniref:Apical endosomal glycoprotein n=1 Tax=Thamnophis sirtalis TaxID=35019 RepID=A0A6I9XBU2_9SAUR|nr:PREDICTED: apical endosomal glycoprotein [Thamnophis sirtalis]
MPGSWGLLSFLLLQMLMVGLPFYVQAVFVNRCGSSRVCDFVCDCWDCSDENQCGYQTASARGAPSTCSFEGTTCGWEDISTTAYRWDPAQASISPWGLEPPFDHTLGTDSGWYMAVTKQRAKPSATARLRSPLLRGAAASCEIRAWYLLWGSGLNETQQPLLTLELSQGNHTVRLWQSPAGGTHSWQELVAYTGHIPGNFQVTFSSTQGFSSSAQLALDDVEFRNCGLPPPQACGAEAFRCQQGSCIAIDRVCDGTADCRGGEDEAQEECASSTVCSFEEDWCQWTPNTTLPWLRNSSLHLASPSLGPWRDHSTNSREGFFVYVEAQKPELHEGRAWLSSPMLASDANQSCYVSDLSHSWRGSSLAEGLGGFPLLVVIAAPLPLSLFLYKILLPSSPCPPGQFACDQGKQCLDLQLLCNFKAECKDASDEQQCGGTDFAKGPGGWMDISVGRLRWTTSRLSSVGPVLSLQGAPGQMFSMARAATPVLGPSGLGCVLQMDFTAGPEGFLALAIADGSLGTRWWAWFAKSNGTASWAEATVRLGARKRPFQLELLARADLDGPWGALPLAVSNISFVNCSAEAPASAPQAGLSCNFETGWCSWSLEQNDGFEWRLSRSRRGAADHTTGTGSFLLAEPGGAWNPGRRAQLISAPQVAAAASSATVEASCLSFWYRMEGPQIGTLALKVKAAGEPERVLWTRRGSHGAVWHQASSSISPKPGQNYQVIFEALRDGFLGSVALDDLTVTPGDCPAQRHCSFEADECSFSAAKQQAWQRQSGAGGGGPPVDHTLGELRGHYLILRTGADRLPLGQVTVLRSRAFPPLLRTHCVSFWYHLNGSEPGSLTAYVKEEEGKEEGAEAGMLSPDPTQGAAWRYGSFVAKVRRRWQVAFTVTGAGGEPTSYIALDDISVKEGNCSEPGSCDFESGPCGWSKPHGDGYSWDWKEAATPLRSPSPEEDHTLGTRAGHYAYVDLAVLSLGKTAARLASEPLAPTTGSCLSFHYHMDFLGHSSPAELRVRLTGAQGERVIWSARGHQSRTWMNRTLLVTSPVEFQIVLEASSGAWESSGVIALDDLHYTAGPDCASPQAGPAEESSSSSSSSLPVSTIAGVAGGVTVLLLLIAAAYCLWKRKGSGERMEEEDGNGPSFDNITFRDDRIILTQMAPDPATS